MIKSRMIDQKDSSLLEKSLMNDEYHQGTTPDFFFAPGSVCNVWEDEKGPVLFVRGTKALRLDVQYVDNKDVRRNALVMMYGFDNFVEKARENGFTEIIFNSNSPVLIKFCKRRLGFVESKGELRKFL